MIDSNQDRGLLTLAELAKRTGVPERTLSFWIRTYSVEATKRPDGTELFSFEEIRKKTFQRTGYYLPDRSKPHLTLEAEKAWAATGWSTDWSLKRWWAENMQRR